MEGITVSRTVHHRKPGSPVRPRQVYIPLGRKVTALQRGMRELDATLDTRESMKARRTR